MSWCFRTWGSSKKGLGLYRKQLISDIEVDLDFKNEVLGQNILGDADFVARLKNEFLETGQVRE